MLTACLVLHLAARPHASPTASGARLRPLPDGIPRDACDWTRTVESNHLDLRLLRSARPAS